MSITTRAKASYKRHMPATIQYAVRALRRRRDMRVCWDFIQRSRASVSRWQRVKLVAQLYWISLRVNCQHTQQEVLAYIDYILCLPAGSSPAVVEAGCFKGGSTAKFSLAAKLAGKKLLVFDSYEGLPDIHEDHGRNIFGVEAAFTGGTYAGTLEEVRANVRKYGHIESCEFVEGWFSDTMPGLEADVAGAYLDVDLAASTKDCLKCLWPKLDDGGRVFSQDGHLPLVLEVFQDRTFWSDIDSAPPPLTGVGVEKLISAQKLST